MKKSKKGNEPIGSDKSVFYLPSLFLIKKGGRNVQ